MSKKESAKNIKSETETLGDPVPITIDPIWDINQELEAVTDKLSRFDLLVKRIELEGIDLDPQAYLQRLRERKRILLKKAKALATQQAEFYNSFFHTQGYRQQMKQLKSDASYAVGVQRKNIRRFARDLPDLLGIPKPQCEILEGEVLPYAHVVRDDVSENLNHDSYAGIEAVEDRLFSSGSVALLGKLYDDEAWYRNDNPDHYRGAYQLIWRLPMQYCDCVAICWLDTEHEIHFSNNAENWGKCTTAFGYTHSVPNALWAPLHLPFFSDPATSLNTTGSAATGRESYGFWFNVPDGTIGQVTLVHGFSLSAQDGSVSVSMIIRVGVDRYNLGDSPPYLRYLMIPIR
jgi:hypothetical protein